VALCAGDVGALAVIGDAATDRTATAEIVPDGRCRHDRAAELCYLGNRDHDPCRTGRDYKRDACLQGERPQIATRRCILRWLGNPLRLKRKALPHLDDRTVAAEFCGVRTR